MDQKKKVDWTVLSLTAAAFRLVSLWDDQGDPIGDAVDVPKPERMR